jgi:hypothetical protein
MAERNPTRTSMSNYGREQEVSQLIKVKTKTLQRWRLEGRGPQFRKFGAAVRYDLNALARWIDAQPAGGDNLPTNDGWRSPAA